VTLLLDSPGVGSKEHTSGTSRRWPPLRWRVAPWNRYAV